MMKSINIFDNSANVQQRGAAMSPDEMMRELKRRKDAERAAVLREAATQARRYIQRRNRTLYAAKIWSC